MDYGFLNKKQKQRLSGRNEIDSFCSIVPTNKLWRKSKNILLYLWTTFHIICKTLKEYQAVVEEMSKNY